MPHSDSALPPPAAGVFATTRWSVVLLAGRGDAPGAAAALAQLCTVYWYPLYAFVRRSGHGSQDAGDLTQEFFARLLEKQWLAVADPERGRFRSFLIAAMKHFLANEWNRSQRLKRGGGRQFVPLDAVDAEERYALEPADLASPERLYDRRWALTLLARTQERLREEMTAAGHADRFAALEPTLVGERTALPYEELAARFGVTETAVKSMVLRLRRRFREVLRDEVTQTIGSEQEVEAELEHLFAALAG